MLTFIRLSFKETYTYQLLETTNGADGETRSSCSLYRNYINQQVKIVFLPAFRVEQVVSGQFARISASFFNAVSASKFYTSPNFLKSKFLR